MRLGRARTPSCDNGNFQITNTSNPELNRYYTERYRSGHNGAVEYVRGVPFVKTFAQTVFSFKRFKGSIIIDSYHTWVVAYTKSLMWAMVTFTTAINRCVRAAHHRHRMRTVMGADKLVLLNDGKVAERGSPKEFLVQGGSTLRCVSCNLKKYCAKGLTNVALPCIMTKSSHMRTY